MHTGCIFIFQTSSRCWKGFLLPRSPPHACMKPLRPPNSSPASATRRWVSCLKTTVAVCPPLVAAGCGAQATLRTSPRRSGPGDGGCGACAPLSPCPVGTSLRLLPRRGDSCHRNRPLLRIARLPGKRSGRLGLLSTAPLPQLWGEHGRRVLGRKIYLLIANEQHLSLLACKQGNLALPLH